MTTRSQRRCLWMVMLGMGLALALGCADGSSPPEKDQGEDLMSEEPETTAPVVVIETNHGEITARLWEDRAPLTVGNFLDYVDANFYEGTIFHRVIPGFMIQGGGMTRQLQRKPTRRPILNEARPELKNRRGTLAMARTNAPNSATSQFFINLKDNDFLDRTAYRSGYCAFGEVIDGMDVVDKIASIETRTVGPHENVPAEAVIIESIRRKGRP